jgi:hypothetical protein
LSAVFTVFVAHLARPAAAEAEALTGPLGLTTYETRLALATAAPSIVLSTKDQGRASDLLALLRARGHGAHLFDDANLVGSRAMTRADDFALDADGMRRTATGELLPYGDVYAILRAVHDSSNDPGLEVRADNQGPRLRATSKVKEREQVAYFFRRSGERPWLLREHHASYAALGDARSPMAFANFAHTLDRMRERATMAVYDDRLLHRRVAEHVGPDGEQSSRDAMDLLAHLLAMTIANQGGSPYR